MAQTARSNTIPCGANFRTVAFGGTAIPSGTPDGYVATTCSGSSANAAIAAMGSSLSAWRSEVALAMGMAGLVWALLASAQGDDGAYRTFADRYVAMAHALQFEGHMATARTMKQQSTPFT